MNTRVLTGITTTGTPHLGNYVGAIRPAVAASRQELSQTQEQLAEMLGVGRTFVTRVVSRMREEGTIATRRGVFIIRDEKTLRDSACGCTTAIENHFDTVLHGIYPIA